MIILDTDCLSLLDRQTGTAYLRLQAKLDEFTRRRNHHNHYLRRQESNSQEFVIEKLSQVPARKSLGDIDSLLKRRSSIS